MKYKLLGRTGVQVSQLCFGTMSFGGDADEMTSAAMYKACRDAGINFFDTANEYNKGVSEEILGRLIQGHRNDLVLTTKVNAQIRPDLNARGTSIGPHDMLIAAHAISLDVPLATNNLREFRRVPGLRVENWLA